MKGARGLLGGVLVLVAICALPAMSAAQGNGQAEPATTTTTPDPGSSLPQDTGPAPAPPSAAPSDSAGGGSPTQSGPTSGDAAAGTPTAAAKDSGETTTQLAGRSPADASRGGAHKSATTVVTMGDFFFSPATVSVAVGDIVTWRNEGHEPHTATADDGSFDTGTVPAGGKASHMFDKPGTFSYICTIHPNMKGTIRVLSSGGAGGSGGAPSSGSGQTEAQAVNSPNAAGDKSTLPMSGLAEGPLALVGLALLASGLMVRRSARRLAPGRQLSLF